MSNVLRIIVETLGGEKAAKELDNLDGSVGGLVKTVAGLAIIQQAGSWLVDFGKQSFEAAAQAERLQRANESLARGLGASSAEMVSNIKTASGGAISELTAMSASTKAMMFDLVQTPQQMAELTRVAVTLGQAMGQDAATSIDDLTTALGRQSPMILDNLGITLKLEDAYNGYAATLGKTAAQLTEEEKKQAFVSEALRIGTERANELGGVTADTATKVETLTASYSDLQVALGSALTSAAEDSGALDYLNRSLEVWTAIAKTVEYNNRDDVQARATEITAKTNEADALEMQLRDLELQANALSRAALVDPQAKDDLAAINAEMARLRASQDNERKAAENVTREIAQQNAMHSKQPGLYASAASGAKALLTSEQAITREIQRGNSAMGARYSAMAAAETAGAASGNTASGNRWAAMATAAGAEIEHIGTGAQITRIEATFARLAETADEAGTGMTRSFSDTTSALKSLIEGQLKPTLSEVWQPGGEDARIDEWGRRAATIMTQGLGSEWIPALNAQFAGTDFWQPIQAALDSGDTAGAQNLLGNLLMQNPQALWDKELIKQRVIAQLQQDNARTELINAIMAELSGQGMQVDAGQVQAAMGVSPVSAPVADSLATGLPGAMAEKEIGANMLSELGKQVAKADDQLRTLANAIASGLESNLKSAMATTGQALLNVIAASVAERLGVELRP